MIRSQKEKRTIYQSSKTAATIRIRAIATLKHVTEPSAATCEHVAWIWLGHFHDDMFLFWRRLRVWFIPRGCI
jgi:hypothetical protein